MKNFLYIFFVISVVGWSSCGKDDNGPGGPFGSTACLEYFSNDYIQVVNQYSEALNAYSLDPTREKCLAVYSALDNYIDALSEYRSCWSFWAGAGGQSVEQFEQALDQYRAELDNFLDNCPE